MQLMKHDMIVSKVMQLMKHDMIVSKVFYPAFVEHGWPLTFLSLIR